MARPWAPCCLNTPDTPVERSVLVSHALPPRLQPNTGTEGSDFRTHCQIPKTKDNGGFTWTLTPAQKLEKKCSGALHGLWERGGCSLRCSRVPSLGTACWGGGLPGHGHTHSAGPGQLWHGSSLAGGPRAHPHRALGYFATPCIHEKSGGLLRCT